MSVFYAFLWLVACAANGFFSCLWSKPDHYGEYNGLGILMNVVTWLALLCGLPAILSS